MAVKMNTNNPTGKAIDQDRVLRFTVGERFSHWVHAVAFFVLLFTGLGAAHSFFQPAMFIVGGMENAMLIHRITAVLFVVLVGIMFFVGDTKHHRGWIKDVFSFGKADLQHVLAFPKEFFGGHGTYPPQDKYNGGEKINSLITIFGSIFVTLSGIVLWFSSSFPPVMVQWAFPIHDLAVIFMSAALVGHMYLGLLHPDSNPSITGMINGYVPGKFARSHHAKWYNRVKGEEVRNKSIEK